MHTPRALALLALAALSLPADPAFAALSRYTVNWNTIIFGGGQSVGGVTVTGRFIGTGRIRSASEAWPGPWVGYSGVAAVEVSFSSPILEHCIYVTAQDAGERLTIRTS
jgi:hypothetical protein